MRRLADDLAAKQLAVQRLMMELEAAVMRCGVRRRDGRAATARRPSGEGEETLEAKVAEEEAKGRATAGPSNARRGQSRGGRWT